MFYKDLRTWSNKKIYKYLAVLYCIFGLLTIVVPACLIAYNYKLFYKTGSFKLTAIGLIVAITLLIVAYKSYSRIVNRINEDKDKLRHLKYVLQLISAIIIPISAGVILYLTYDSWKIAYNTIMPCIYCYTAAMIVHYLFIKDLEWLQDVRAEALHQNTIDEQKKYVK